MARTYQRRSNAKAPRPVPKKGLGPPVAPKKKRVAKSGVKKEGLRTKLLWWTGIFLLCCLVAGFAFSIGGYLGLVRAVNSLEEPSAESSHPTYIYSAPVGDTEGSARVIGTVFGGENRKMASFEDMPPSLLDALVAKEDERFREHGGVDFWGIVRALWVNVLIKVGILAEDFEGASTITQQYVKNAYLSDDPTLERKLREALIAVELERRHDKDEILGMYLNNVYFGNNAYGVEAAAETYFNKSTEDLTIGESATLVGLLWSPSSLGTNSGEAANQRNIVLGTMRDLGYITRQEHMEALDEALPKPWPKAPMMDTGLTGPGLTKNFAEFVREEVVKQYGARAVLMGGLSVYTTLDLKAQVEAQEILYDSNGYLKNPDDPDAALVSIEPGTGRITTMIGNRDKESHFNLVTQARRQPGSSFKPFALIAALEQGMDLSTQFVSESKHYVVKDKEGNPEEWNVENYEYENRGLTSLEQALWYSDNSVVSDLVTNAEGRGLKNGPEAVANVANRLGVSAELETHPSIALGTQEVSPLDMATAYATIANGGRKVTPTGIEKVVRNESREDEEVLYAAERVEGKQVIAPEIAREVTELMVGNISQGIAHKASLGNRPAAGKTGTTENFFDSWFVGFTPQLVTGVWMGYEEGGRTLEGLLNIGGQQFGPLAPPTVIWQTYMQKVLEDKPIEDFKGVGSPQAPSPTSPTAPNAQSPAGGSSTGGPMPVGVAPDPVVGAPPLDPSQIPPAEPVAIFPG
jgi:penicillin-binding protein 1A